MMKDWEEREWNDVLEIRSGRGYKNVLDENGKYPIIGSAGKVMGYANDYICEGGTTIVGRKGTINNPMFIDKPFWNVDTAFGLHAKIELDKMFLHYFCLGFDFSKMDRGSGRPSLVKSDLLKIRMFVPRLPEQQRIVSLLDEAFAAIDKAKTNAEKSLQNAKELFKSYLDSVDAEKVPLGNLVEIKTGKLNANAAVENGKYPFFTCARQVYAIDHYSFDLEAILLAGNNASGDFNVKHYSGKFNAYQRTYIITINKKNQALYRYIYFQLLKSLKEFKKISIGANTRFLKIGMIRDLMIALPSLEEQQRIVATLDSLLSETQQLETLYQKKIAALDELKKSILQKAFRGELEPEKE